MFYIKVNNYQMPDEEFACKSITFLARWDLGPKELLHSS